MSIWALAFPAEAALPLVEKFALAAVRSSRPLLGLGAAAGLLMLFKPLLIGILQAALLLLRPRRTLAQRSARQRLRDVVLLERLARRMEASQPNQAAELRALAARD
jgi:hypothetical protein